MIVDGILIEDLDKLSEAYKTIIETLGFSFDDPNFVGTPDRAARAIWQMTAGSVDTEEKIAEIMQAKFPAEYDEMVVVADIQCTGLCPHHLLPINYKMMIGYIPSKLCLGISKLARLGELLSARPVMQEQLTTDIVSALKDHISPQGIGVKVEGVHGCMVHRGVKQKDAVTITTRFAGAIKKDPAARAEFLSYWR